MAESNSAASTSKPALSSLEKKSSAKGHPDFYTKKIKLERTIFLLRKIDIATFF
jgi:hypothetical protein